MQNNLLIILILIGVGITLTNLAVWWSLRRLKKKGYRETAFADERYTELKIKFQTMTSTLIVVGIAIAFMGWNIKSQIVSELRQEVSAEVDDEIESLLSRLQKITRESEKMEKEYNQATNVLSQLTANFIEISNSYLDFSQEMETKLSSIKSLLSIYLVPDVLISPSAEPIRLYYKDLTPINAEKLPTFKTPPIINIEQSGLRRTIYIKEKTNEHVEFVFGSAGDAGSAKITLWIVER